MRKKNKKREKTFAVNYKVADELLSSLKQMTLLADAIVDPLILHIKSKGYKPVSKAKVIPLINLQSDAPKDVYKISIKAVYVGKRKAKED